MRAATRSRCAPARTRPSRRAPAHPARPRRLVPWRGALQGAALDGADAWELAADLAALGVSRITGPGELQTPDARWHNGGIDPLDALAGAQAP